jgi:hypothetical protein
MAVFGFVGRLHGPGVQDRQAGSAVGNHPETHIVHLPGQAGTIPPQLAVTSHVSACTYGAQPPG